MCSIPIRTKSIVGPGIISQYEIVRKSAIFAGIKTFLHRRDEFSQPPPLSLLLKIALKCELIFESNSGGRSEEQQQQQQQQQQDFMFDLCKPLFFNYPNSTNTSSSTSSSSPSDFLLDYQQDNNILMRYFPKTSGYQWSRYHHLLSTSTTLNENFNTVSEDGLLITSSSFKENTSSTLVKWRQVQFHVGTHGMMSGMFYMELAPHYQFLNSSSTSSNSIVLAIGLTSHPETETFDCGCRMILNQDDGIGVLLDLKRGLLSFHPLMASDVQTTRSTRRITLPDEILSCEVPSTRPMYFAMVILTENCIVRSVFAENAEEQIVSGNINSNSNSVGNNNNSGIVLNNNSSSNNNRPGE
jgi:hypothetical protein